MPTKPQKPPNSYLISVSLMPGCYRHIRIGAGALLLDLHAAILDAFEFDDDHAHAFFMDNKAWSDHDAYYTDMLEDEDRFTSEVTLGQLSLTVGRQFKYVFDFGDDWRFQCKVLKILDEATERPVVVRSVGEAPPQYGGADDEWDGDWGDEEAEVDDPADMPSDRLYDIAFQFKKTKLWNKLYDSQLFAVKHSDGTVGYCCVMGMMGEHLALAVYPGDEGLGSYRLLGRDRSELSDFEVRELAMAQNCLMCSFENKDELRPRELAEARQYCKAHQITVSGKNAYPQFQRFRPHYFPWYVDDEADQTRLWEALEACLEVSAKLKGAPPESLGFTEGPPFDRGIPLLEKRGGSFLWSKLPLPAALPVVYPSPEPCDELQLARVLKSKKRGGEWACDVLMHIQPMSNEKSEAGFVHEPKNAPFYPYLLLIVDNISGMVLGLHLSSDPEEYLTEFTDGILETAKTISKPTRILVRNERTRALFTNFAKQFGAELRMRKKIPLLEEAEEELWEQFDADEDSSEDDLERLVEILSDPESLAGIPDQVLVQIAKIARMGALTDELAENLNQECERRGL